MKHSRFTGSLSRQYNVCGKGSWFKCARLCPFSMKLGPSRKLSSGFSLAPSGVNFKQSTFDLTAAPGAPLDQGSPWHPGRALCPEEASAPADTRAGCRRGGKAQSRALEYVSRSAQGLGARSGRGSGRATVRVDAAAIGQSDRRGQCGSGQRGGEAFPPTPGTDRRLRALAKEAESYLSNVQS